jgi:hypothetical protein
MQKRGQVTLFIILGVVILITAAGILLIIHQTREAALAPTQNVLPEQSNIQTFTQSCLDQTSKDSIDLLAANGGFLPLPQHITVQYTEDQTITLIYLKRASLIPTLINIQNDIENYINQNLRYCLDDFAIYQEQGWTVAISNVTTKASLNDDETIITSNFPAKLERGNVTITLSQSITRLQISIPKILREMQKITGEEQDAQQKLDKNSELEQLPRIFTRNNLIIRNQPYPDRRNLLWIIESGDTNWYFATRLETK